MRSKLVLTVLAAALGLLVSGEAAALSVGGIPLKATRMNQAGKGSWMLRMFDAPTGGTFASPGTDLKSVPTTSKSPKELPEPVKLYTIGARGDMQRGSAKRASRVERQAVSDKQSGSSEARKLGKEDYLTRGETVEIIAQEFGSQSPQRLALDSQLSEDAPATRALMAELIITALEGEPPGDSCAYGSSYEDVYPDSPACKYIKRLYEIVGDADGDMFYPEAPVTKEQLSEILEQIRFIKEALQ